MGNENAESWARRHRRLLVRLPIVAVLLAAAVVIFVPELVAPWSRLNNEEQDFDLCTGRQRITRYFLYGKISQDVRDTSLSEAVSRSGQVPNGEKWVHVCVFPPFSRMSPNFIYHGAFAEIRELELYWRLYNFQTAAQEKSAVQLLRAMREGGSDNVGNKYLRRLQEVMEKEPPGRETTAADTIPDDLADRVLAEHSDEIRRQ
jgi:hypothetical protein